MRTDDEIAKFPALRSDLKISRQVQSERVTFIVKDPVKGEYYRFDEAEWAIIRLFDGTETLNGIVQKYLKFHPGRELSIQDVKDYQQSLSSISLLDKPAREKNVMLLEKMKESRNLQLLSKKGSLMYKRFPLVDPDKFFDRVIPQIRFFWSPGFFWFATACIGNMFFLIFTHWGEFHTGLRDIFSFSEMSWWHLAALWVTIYATIAIHELGHGLTCKYYGGEVRELGVLLLFFQPCLYANVNDAWLFDKKWKQVMVTIAGGFIELWVGSIFAIVWVATNPLTFVNVLAFQVVTICTASTILANFNPLVKLDGYYLLSDYLELPNLRENAFKYFKHVVSRRIFGNQEEEFDASTREKRVFLAYGILSFLWVSSTTLGLFYLAKGFLEERFHEFGVLLTAWVAWKLFGAHAKKSGLFIAKWFIERRAAIRERLKSRNFRFAVGVAGVGVLALLLTPMPFAVPGQCSLEAAFAQVLRAESDGFLAEFYRHDGESVKPGDRIARLENFTLLYDRKIAGLAADKVESKIRDAMSADSTELGPLRKELEFKRSEELQKARALSSLEVAYSGAEKQAAILSCDDEVKKTQKFIRRGDEICRVLGVGELKAVIDVSETQVRFIREGDAAEFKLRGSPFTTYHGTVNRIRMMGIKDPKNPKERTYRAEMTIHNPGELRPGMSGVARIVAEPVSLVANLGRKLTGFFRLDLFF